MVFLAIKDGGVVHHTSLQALKDMDGIDEPDMEIPDSQFEAAGCLARVIDGVIFIGKTEEEITADENKAKVVILKQKLADTDYISAKIAEGSATKAQCAEKIAERQAWREEINRLEPKG